MFWESVEQFKEAIVSAEGQEIMADVPKFSDKAPVSAFGKKLP